MPHVVKTTKTIQLPRITASEFFRYAEKNGGSFQIHPFSQLDKDALTNLKHDNYFVVSASGTKFLVRAQNNASAPQEQLPGVPRKPEPAPAQDSSGTQEQA